MLTWWGEFILGQWIRISIPKTSSKRSRAGQLEWMMLCSAASHRSTTTSTQFLGVGVEAFVLNCLLDGTEPRWRCGEWRKTMRWTLVVRAQIHRFVVCYIHSHGRTQADGVYRIDGMSARRPPCRVCPGGTMPGCRCVETEPSWEEMMAPGSSESSSVDS